MRNVLLVLLAVMFVFTLTASSPPQENLQAKNVVVAEFTATHSMNVEAQKIIPVTQENMIVQLFPIASKLWSAHIAKNTFMLWQQK